MKSQTEQPSSEAQRKRLVGVVGFALTLALVAVVLGVSFRTSPPADMTDASSPFSQSLSADDEPRIEFATDARGNRYPVYRHSVVSGGVHSKADVERAIRRDHVVSAHYAAVSVADLKVVRTTARREAYMSYRIGDRVYWTAKKIALASGETVLTDGHTTIRARCGNLMSDEAMAPTSGQEPDITSFDEVVNPDAEVGGDGGAPGVASDAAVAGASGTRKSGSGPSLSAFNQTDPGGNNGFGSGYSGGSGGSGGGLVPGRPAGPGSSRDPGGNEPGTSRDPGSNPPGSGNPTGGNPPTFGGGPNGGDQPPGSNPPGDNPRGGNPPGSNPPGGNPPGGDNPPGGGNPPGGKNPPDGPGPGGPGGPGGPQGPPGPGPDPRVPPVDELTPPELVPVPEPATLLLFGSGLALTAWHARHRRSKSKESKKDTSKEP